MFRVCIDGTLIAKRRDHGAGSHPGRRDTRLICFASRKRTAARANTPRPLVRPMALCNQAKDMRDRAGRVRRRRCFAPINGRFARRLRPSAPRK